MVAPHSCHQHWLALHWPQNQVSQQTCSSLEEDGLLLVRPHSSVLPVMDDAALFVLHRALQDAYASLQAGQSHCRCS